LTQRSCIAGAVMAATNAAGGGGSALLFGIAAA
jgi:hypothetical protein